jgi:LmbE family N-acetylglucosaminyl deacetylase
MIAVSPHPDDEVLGAGGALYAARAADQPAEVLAVSLGRPDDHARRHRELEQAVAALDVTLTILDPPLALSDPDKPGEAEACLAERLADVLASVEVPWLIAPSVHDHHPSYELVGRAVRDTIESLGRRSSVWWWRLWGQGGPGTTAVVLDHAEQALLAALSHHQGELARNQYRELLSARLTADAVLGAEQLFGFGAPLAVEARGDLLRDDLLRQPVDVRHPARDRTARAIRPRRAWHRGPVHLAPQRLPVRHPTKTNRSGDPAKPTYPKLRHTSTPTPSAEAWFRHASGIPLLFVRCSSAAVAASGQEISHVRRRERECKRAHLWI